MPTSRFHLAWVERWIDALLDPQRQERTVGWTLVAYAAVWTAYRAIATLPRDLHADVTELYAWSRDLAFGYDKHPPFSAFVTKAWFTLFPVSDLMFHALATFNIALTLYIAWRTMRRYMGAEKSAFGLALLMLIPFFNFIALKYNANAVLLPLWALTIHCFLRAFEQPGRRLRDLAWPALAGAFAGAAMLGKYWSIVLVASLGLAALIDPRRAALFRSPAPWLMIAVGAAVLAPHLVWLVQHHFPSFAYATSVHPAASLAGNVVDTLSYLLGCIAYVSLVLVAAYWLLRPSRAALAEIAAPADPQRRLMLLILLLLIVLPTPFALLSGIRITPLWTMPSWTLLPIVLLASPLVSVDREAVRRLAVGAALLSLTMLVLAPAVALVIHRTTPPESFEYASVLAGPIEREWQRRSDRPIQLVAGDTVLAMNTAYYLRTRTKSFDRDDVAAIAAAAHQYGAVLVCPATEAACLATANKIAADQPEILRGEVRVTRSLFGIEGTALRDVFMIVQPPAK
ncbi:MAG: glycosyltransferase family 39 protein [Rhodopseudomonas sp.]|uniref:glycosyltransferase family 39 protein n=1 Tax=Rhodopseudomonas sp. TaxID=1078 RepID=UPI00184A3D6F|nr:glycosyltransferase family 39 protein [Rhodopseudomonas sp.]NVN85955.1 glycosyltransferase family 39 protein [Rhodopseudomonas sp.]